MRPAAWGYGREHAPKFDYARYLAASLGYLLLHQRDATGLITFDTNVRNRFDPSANPQKFPRMTDLLERRKARTGNEPRPCLRADSAHDQTPEFDCDSQRLFRPHRPFIDGLETVPTPGMKLSSFTSWPRKKRIFPYKRPTKFHSLERSRHQVLVDPHQLRSCTISSNTASSVRNSRKSAAVPAWITKS